MVKLVCVIEVRDAYTVEEAQSALDMFREAVQSAQQYGLTIYRATEQDADTAIYMSAAD